MSSTRPRRPRRSAPATLALALGGFAVAAIAAWVALTAPNGVPGMSYYTLRAQLADLSGLGVHNEVRIAGRRVGQVLDPRIDERGRPTVELQLRGDVEPLRSDTRVVVRSKGLLGQRFLELRPGRRGRELRDGDTLAASQGSATVELPSVLSTFDARRRRALHALVNALGEGTLGRGGDLNEMLATAPGVLDDLGALSRAVTANAARNFVPSLESAMAGVDPVRDTLTAGFDPAARALAPLGDRRAAVQATLETAPPALRSVRAGLARTDPLLATAEGLARTTTRALAPAPAALRTARRLLVAAPRPLRRTDALLRRVRPATPAMLRLARVLTPELPRLDAALADARPPLDELGSRPCDVLGYFRNWRSMLGFGVPGGGEIGPLNVLRLELLASAESIGELPTGLDAGRVGRNPYPAPCEAGTEPAP